MFINVPPIDVSEDPAAVPVIPDTDGADQVYVVPVGTISVPFVGLTLNATLEQIVCVLLVITGVGLTTTETVNGVPEHEYGDDPTTITPIELAGEFVKNGV